MDTTTVPRGNDGIALRVGSRTRVYGQLIGSRNLLEDDPRVVAIAAELEADVAKAVAAACRDLDRLADSDRLVVEHGRAIVQAIVDHPFSEPVGLAVGAIRRAVGMSGGALARHMGRSAGMVRRWERGERTTAHVGDLHGAARALGFDATALMLVADETRREHREAIAAR